jgi:hypothetical protein
MFQPNCRAIFRLIFEQVECTIDNVFKFKDQPEDGSTIGSKHVVGLIV